MELHCVLADNLGADGPDIPRFSAQKKKTGPTHYNILL